MTLFAEWTNGRSVSSLGTNSGTEAIAFQGWHKFKEAFPPELIQRAIAEQSRPVAACLDPFGGSGTTALAAQFLGVGSTTIEVNPFLADVIRAKLSLLAADRLSHDLGQVCARAVRSRPQPPKRFRGLPDTFIQPGRDGRWLFDADVAARIDALLHGIDGVSDPTSRRFFRVILSGLLIQVSNVTVNGKGRRYRRNWEKRRVDPVDVDRLFVNRATDAIADIYRFADRPTVKVSVVCGDARSFRSRREHDLAVFSPPYPNSFDYTDVYNVELWMLGYLTSGIDNRRLRTATLSSHVQLQRNFAVAPEGSKELTRSVRGLERVREHLWSPWIPAMVGAYFNDLSRVLSRVHSALRANSQCWIVVGDSRYGGVFVPSGRIIAELAPRQGWAVESTDPFRSMRSSSQHGGADELHETLLVLRRR